MAKTKLENIIIPENFNSYVAEKATEKNAFFRSGILVDNPHLRDLLAGGGKTIHIPFMKPLVGHSEIPTEDTDIVIDHLETEEDVARRQLRVKAFGENQLASLLSGANVMDAIANAYADYWADEYTKTLVSTAKGVFAKLDGKVHDKSTVLFNVSDAIDAKFLLGDAHDRIGAVAVHSKVYALMLKQDQVDNVPNSEGTGYIKIYKPLQCEVIVDDKVPYNNSTHVASMYMFGKGAIGFCESEDGIIGTEIHRDPLKGLGDNALIQRKQFVLHPLGVKWTETDMSNNVAPKNLDLEKADNWEQVALDKNIALCEYKFKTVTP